MVRKKSKQKQIRPRQERGIKTYEKLVIAGMQILAETDLGSLRFSQVSKVSKVPQSLIDYHFPSMESFQFAIVQYKLNQMFAATFAALEKNKNKPRKALEAYVKVPFEFAETDKEFLAVWTAYYHLITRNKNFASFNATVQKTGHERIMNLVRSVLVDEGLRLKQNMSLEEISHSVHGVIIGFSMMASTTPELNFKKWHQLALSRVSELLTTSTQKS